MVKFLAHCRIDGVYRMFYCRYGNVFHVAGISAAGYCHPGDYSTNLGTEYFCA